jgi:NADPH2:quinone reductase
MHAWLCTTPTGVETLKWTEQPTPQPGPGQVLLEVKAASLNFPDLLIVQNKYQIKPPLPFVPGSEYAGVVQAVGEGVKHLKPGQHVACLSGTGGFATHTLAPAAMCMPLPADFPFVDAAAFIMTYATSHHALIDRGQLKAGETVLVLGAAGGVARQPYRLPRRPAPGDCRGLHRREMCAVQGPGCGPHHQLQPGRSAEAIKAATDGKGPDVIYDPVGGDFAEPAFRSIAWRGRYLIIGFASGPIPSLPLNLPLLKGASLVGVFWGDFAKREPQNNAAMMQELSQWWAQGRIKPVIDRTMPMSELFAAYERMGSRQVQGKLVLVNA